MGGWGINWDGVGAGIPSLSSEGYPENVPSLTLSPVKLGILRPDRSGPYKFFANPSCVVYCYAIDFSSYFGHCLFQFERYGGDVGILIPLIGF